MVEYRCLASADNADNSNTSGSNEGSGALNEMLHTDARGDTATAVKTTSVRCEPTKGCAATNAIVEQHPNEKRSLSITPPSGITPAETVPKMIATTKSIDGTPHNPNPPPTCNSYSTGEISAPPVGYRDIAPRPNPSRVNIR